MNLISSSRKGLLCTSVAAAREAMKYISSHGPHAVYIIHPVSAVKLSIACWFFFFESAPHTFIHAHKRSSAGEFCINAADVCIQLQDAFCFWHNKKRSPCRPTDFSHLRPSAANNNTFQRSALTKTAERDRQQLLAVIFINICVGWQIRFISAGHIIVLLCLDRLHLCLWPRKISPKELMLGFALNCTDELGFRFLSKQFIQGVIFHLSIWE